jgi:hypothetical protein
MFFRHPETSLFHIDHVLWHIPINDVKAVAPVILCEEGERTARLPFDSSW